MAGDAIAVRPPLTRPRIETTFAECAFVLFLVLVFISLRPFAPRDPAALAAAAAGLGAGDMMRQLAYLTVFALISLAALQRIGLRAILPMAPSLACLLAWCALSALWATAPDVVLRRVLLEFVIIASVATGVSAVGATRSLTLILVVLTAVLIINWVSIPFVQNA